MTDTLEEAKQYLRDNWESGVPCPCCQRFVKLYPYTFNSAMAQLIIFMYKRHLKGEKQVHIEKELAKEGKRSVQVQSKLVHWALIKPVTNTDSKKRKSGLYEITPQGIEFAARRAVVPKQIKYFNYKIYALSNENVDIQEALGTDFDYTEMMKGV